MKKKPSKQIAPAPSYPEGMIIAVDVKLQAELLVCQQEMHNGRVLMDHGAEKVRHNQEMVWKKIHDQYPGLIHRQAKYNHKTGCIMVGGNESE